MALEKAIIKSAHAVGTTFEYKARELNSAITDMARDFVSIDRQMSPDFKISQLVAEQSGISQLESDAVQDKISARVLERLAEVQEKAYKEGFELGRTEGAERSFRQSQDHLHESLASFDALMARIETLKSRLLVDNEASLIRLLYLVARKVALRDIAENPGAVLPVLTQIVGEMQSAEHVTINISATDLEFINLLRDQHDPRVENLGRAKFVVGDAMQPGGCTIETNFGSVDASIEERVERAWAALDTRTPKNAPEETPG